VDSPEVVTKVEAIEETAVVEAVSAVAAAEAVADRTMPRLSSLEV